MPDNDQDNRWNRLLDAAKDAGATEEHELPGEAPASFVSRVIAMRQGLWKFAKTVLWRRWSLVAALIAITLYLIVFFTMKSNPPTPAPAPVAPPTLPLPPEP